MYNFIICGIFKNEAHILDEWISHYIYHGVDHIYLVNDFSSDSYLEIIERYSDKVSLFHNDIITKEVGRQTKIYEKYFTPLLSKSKWMSILDLDEFLYSPYEVNLLKCIEEIFGEYSQIIIDWVHFGSNDHILQPNSVVEGFTKRAYYGKKKEYYGYKNIFRTKDFLSFGVHINNVKGRQIRLINNEFIEKVPMLVINHYNLQSYEYYSMIKATRGDCDNWFDHRGISRDKRLFDEYDDNDVEDLKLFEQNKNIIRLVKENKISVQDEVTFIITSCNRPYLLEKTLFTFIKYNTYPIVKTIILDDSGIIGCNEEVVKKYKDQLNIISIYNKTNIKQIASIDKLYSYVKTKYIFHCEEDWEFLKSGFIEKSKEIFDKNPNEKIFTVWLRPHNDTSRHPIIYRENEEYHLMDNNYSYYYKNKKYIWHGVTFNPGLRKTLDMYLFHPYIYRCTLIDKNGRKVPEDGEYTINKIYGNYKSYILGDRNGHIKHIGWNHHINMN
jgi:hypothetical protein